MFGWLKRWRESRALAEVLEVENEQLRGRLKDLEAHMSNVMALCRALRDVNADLDTKLQQVISWGE